jgi:hypothetical protein
MKVLSAPKFAQPIRTNNQQKQVSFKANCQPILKAAPQKDMFVKSKAKAVAKK